MLGEASSIKRKDRGKGQIREMNLLRGHILKGNLFDVYQSIARARALARKSA